MRAGRLDRCMRCGCKTDLRTVWCQPCWDTAIPAICKRNGVDIARYKQAMEAELMRRV